MPETEAQKHRRRELERQRRKNRKEAEQKEERRKEAHRLSQQKYIANKKQQQQQQNNMTDSSPPSPPPPPPVETPQELPPWSTPSNRAGTLQTIPEQQHRTRLTPAQISALSQSRIRQHGSAMKAMDELGDNSARIHEGNQNIHAGNQNIQENSTSITDIHSTNMNAEAQFQRRVLGMDNNDAIPAIEPLKPKSLAAGMDDDEDNGGGKPPAVPLSTRKRKAALPSTPRTSAKRPNSASSKSSSKPPTSTTKSTPRQSTSTKKTASTTKKGLQSTPRTSAKRPNSASSKSSSMPPTSTTKSTPRRSTSKKTASTAKKVAKGTPKSSALSVKEQRLVATLAMDNTYKFGSVPTNKEAQMEGVPVVDYAKHWSYEHFAQSIIAILQKYPGKDIYLYKETETAKVATSFIEFDVFYALIVPHGESPPACLQLKGMETETSLVTFSALNLEWVDIKGLLKTTTGTGASKAALQKFSDMTKGRVFALQYKGRKIRNPTDEEKSLFCRARLLDCRTSQFPPKDNQGRVLVESARFHCDFGTEHVTDVYVKSGAISLSLFIDQLIEDLEDKKGVQADADVIKQSIRDGFQKARDIIQEFHDENVAIHDLNKVDNIRVCKVYPCNINENASVGAKQRQAADDWAYHVSEAQVKEKAEALDAALENFHYTGHQWAVQYGPVQDPDDLFFRRAGEGPLPGL